MSNQFPGSGGYPSPAHQPNFNNQMVGNQMVGNQMRNQITGGPMGSPISMMSMGNINMPNQMAMMNAQINFNQAGMMSGMQQSQQSPQQSMQSPGTFRKIINFKQPQRFMCNYKYRNGPWWYTKPIAIAC